MQFQFEITNKCNLGCIQCGVIRRGIENTLPISLFQKLWNEFYFVNGISWLGGEVFLVDYFLDLIETINSEFPHINHTIYTNGILIDDNIASVLVKINNLQLKFSIDSIEKETYERLRSKGKFELLLKNIKFLNDIYRTKNKKQNFAVNVIVMKSNLEQIISYPDFCREYGISSLDISFLADVNPPHLVEENLFYNIDFKLLEKIRSILNSVEIKCKKYGIKLFCNFASFVDINENYVKNEVDRRRIDSYGVVKKSTKNGDEFVGHCNWPWHSLYIKSTGVVVPTGDCVVPLGNILESSIDEIWNNPIMQVYRYKIIKSDLSNWCAYHCQQRFEVNKKLVTL
jgi:MoaA/NifB/PqqE/SkfB family radical SAM enzyme